MIRIVHGVADGKGVCHLHVLGTACVFRFAIISEDPLHFWQTCHYLLWSALQCAASCMQHHMFASRAESLQLAAAQLTAMALQRPRSAALLNCSKGNLCTHLRDITKMRQLYGQTFVLLSRIPSIELHCTEGRIRHFQFSSVVKMLHCAG